MSARVCYLICFRDPQTGQPKRYEHAGHYLGTTTADRLDEHVEEHRTRHVAVLTAAARAAGLDFKVTRTWPGGHRKERQLKTRSGALYCPDCTPHPQPGDKPPRLGAKYLTRRQREAAAREREAQAASAQKPERTPLWLLERTAVEAEPHQCGSECKCGQIEAAVSRFLQGIGAEPTRKESEMTGDKPLDGAALDAAIEEAAAQFPDLTEPSEPVPVGEAVRDWMADLPAEGREFLREALADAIEYREPGDYCADCGPDELCIDHAEDLERADAYRERLEMLQADIGAGYQPEPLPRQLGPAEAADALAPLAAELPDGTPHADPALAVRGWQAQGGIYVREPVAQMEAG